MELESGRFLDNAAAMIAHIEMWRIVNTGAGRMSRAERQIVFAALESGTPDPNWRVRASLYHGAQLEPEARGVGP